MKFKYKSMRHFSIRYIVLIFIIFLSSCGQETNFYVIIPEDAHAVIKVDYKKLTRDLSKDSAEIFSHEFFFIEDQSVNHTQPIVVAFNEEDYLLAFVSLNNKEEFLGLLKKEYELTTISNSENEEIYSVGEDFIVGFNSSVAAFYVPFDDNKDLSLLRSCLKDEEVKVLAPKYVSVVNADDQVNMWLDAEKLFDEMGYEGVVLNSIVDDAFVLASLNLKKGEVEIKSVIQGAEMATYVVDKFIKSASNKYLKYVPENPELVLNVGLKNLDMLAMMLPELKKELNKDYEFLYDIISKVNGTVTLAVYEPLKDNFELDFVLVVESDKDSYQSLTQELYKLGAPIEKFSTYYIIDNNYYLMYKDNAIILMSEKHYSQKGITAKLSLPQDRLERINKGGILLNDIASQALLKKIHLHNLDLEYSSITFSGSKVDLNLVLKDKEVHPLDKIFF